MHLAYFLKLSSLILKVITNRRYQQSINVPANTKILNIFLTYFNFLMYFPAFLNLQSF